MTDDMDPRDSEELDFAEMTTEELRDLLATGETIVVDLGERMYAAVTLADVEVWVAIPLKGHALQELTSGLPEDVRLAVPPRTEDIIPQRGVHAASEPALLQRALEAREMLVGKPTDE